MIPKKPFSLDQIHFAAVAVDTVILTIKDNELLVRLTTVHRPPHYTNCKGLPGGLVDPKETAEEAVLRLIKTKAYLDSDKTYLEQLYTFSGLDRNPRGRVIAIAYLALVPWEKLSEAEWALSEEAWWSPLREAKNMAYDHDQIFRVALTRLKSRVTYTTVIEKLMPKEFTLTELEHCYESILGTELDKRNFRKKILRLGILVKVPRKKSGGRFRPAQLYRFSVKKVTEVEML